MDNLYEIKEEDATNGLLINGDKCHHAMLGHNDIIQLGGAFFVFRNDRKPQKELKRGSSSKGLLSKIKGLLSNQPS